MSAHAHAGLVHQALVYDSREEFVRALAPFVRAGRERGERVFAATSARNAAALREELGADAEAVDFRDAGEWYRQPYRTLAAYHRYVDEHANGSIVRVIGEPVWDGRSPAAVREWTRYEAALNVAFSGSPAWIVCPYDATSLPEEIVEHALRTHPELARGERAEPSPGFVAPERLFDLLDGAASAPAPAAAAALAVEGMDVRGARRFVAAEARRAGLEGERVDELVLAASELVGNAARHGRHPIAVRLWRDAGEVVCEVEDAGPGYADRLAGCAPPPAAARSSRGLWLVRQLCDSVDVRRGGASFAVRVRVGLGD